MEEEKIKKLKELFIYYCQFGERLNTGIMKSHSYIKLYKESGIMDNKLNNTRLELIYKTENKYNTLNFQQFLNTIVKIAQFKYPNYSNPKQLKFNVDNIINDYLLVLYEKIFVNNLSEKNIKNLNDKNLYDSIITPNFFHEIFYCNFTQKVIKHICVLFYKIYKKYFEHEISISENYEYIKKNSDKNFLEFINDFELAPGIISKSLAYQVYQSEINENGSEVDISKNIDYYYAICKKLNLEKLKKSEIKNSNILGIHFTFFKFLRSLIKMSQLSFIKTLPIQILKKTSNYEKIILFFQQIEQSEGLKNFQLKTHSTKSYEEALIIDTELLKQIKEDINYLTEEEREQINSKKLQEQIRQNLKNRILDKVSLFEPELTKYINDIYGNDLADLFKSYCNQGDPFNYNYMKSKQFLKFLIDSNLIIENKKKNLGFEITEVDTLFIKLNLLQQRINKLNNFETKKKFSTSIDNIDKLFFKKINKSMITSNNSKAYIDYNIFLIFIEIICYILFPDLNIKNGVNKLINEFILNNKTENMNKIKEIEKKIEFLKNIQNNEEVVKALEITYNVITPLYNYYTKDTNGLLSKENFLNFCKDYEIFPYLISKSKLSSFFEEISLYSSYESKNNNILIEQSLFIDLLTLMAFETSCLNDELNYVEKIINFLLLLKSNNGNNNIIKKIGSNKNLLNNNFVDEFINEFPKYFETESEMVENFENIMNIKYDEK